MLLFMIPYARCTILAFSKWLRQALRTSQYDGLVLHEQQYEVEGDPARWGKLLRWKNSSGMALADSSGLSPFEVLSFEIGNTGTSLSLLWKWEWEWRQRTVYVNRPSFLKLTFATVNSQIG